MDLNNRKMTNHPPSRHLLLSIVNTLKEKSLLVTWQPAAEFGGAVVGVQEEVSRRREETW